MNLLSLTQTLSHLQIAQRPQQLQDGQPYIALIYGFASREHMQRHLLRLLRTAGYVNVALYGHLQAADIAQDLQQAAMQGHPLVVIGFSQGGLEAVRVVHLLEQKNVLVQLLVTIAAGGRGGRYWPHRWQDNPRAIPKNVRHCLNYFSESDFLGTDPVYSDNLAYASLSEQTVENIVFTKADKVSHLAITQCYPVEKIKPVVQEKLINRILSELSRLQRL